MLLPLIAPAWLVTVPNFGVHQELAHIEQLYVAGKRGRIYPSSISDLRLTWTISEPQFSK